MADKNNEVSITDKTFMSEMGVHSTPVNQLEGSSTESVKINGPPVPVSYTHLDVYKRQVVSHLY